MMHVQGGEGSYAKEGPVVTVREVMHAPWITKTIPLRGTKINHLGLNAVFAKANR
jgi:hypothetical protein